MKNQIYLVFCLFLIIVSCAKKEEPIPTPTIIYQDDLSKDNNTWEKDSTSRYFFKFNQGHYTATIDAVNLIAYNNAPNVTINFPYAVQCDMIIQLKDTNKLGNAGIIFNYVDNKNFVVAEFFTNGTYQVWRSIKGTYSFVINSTYTTAVKKGGKTNTFKVIQNRTTAEIIINNTSVRSFALSLPSANCKSGPLAGTEVPINYYTPLTVLFNNFILYKN